MGTFHGQGLINELATRLRDPSNVAYPRATVLNTINRVQDSLNVRLGLVFGTASFTTTDTALYATSVIATDYAYPVQLFDDSSRELDLIEFNRLTQQDSGWLRRHGRGPAVYAPIGRELLAISPIPKNPMVMSLRYVKHPTALADAATPTWDLPDEHKPLLLDMCEGLLLLRARDFRAIQDALNRAAPKLGLEDALQTMRHQTVGDRLKVAR